MISKVEAIQKLRKLGYQVGDNHSIVTILIPHNKIKKTTIGEIKEVLKEMGYGSSFCVQSYKEEEVEQTLETEEDFFDEEDEVVTEEKSVLLEEEDGQFSLASFGLED